MTTIREAKKEYRKYSRWCQDPKASPAVAARWAAERDRYKSIWENLRMEALKERISNLSDDIDFDEWIKWAKTLYSIEENNGNFTVKSVAKNWKSDKTWTVDSKVSAYEKIERLIDYKDYDRNRNIGDREEDLKHFEIKNGQFG